MIKIGNDEIVPVENRKKTVTISKHGLWPHEILVLDYAKSFFTSGNSFQGFWWYQYGVRDVQSILNSLLARGFLQVGGIRATLESQNATAVKEVLKVFNCKMTGKSSELVQRALDEIPENELSKRFIERPYALTELGEIAIRDEEYVMYAHRNSFVDLDIWALNQLVYSQPNTPFRDKIWCNFNQVSTKHFSDNNFGLYRNSRLNMAQFLLQENKFENALGMLAEVVFYDLSGLTNNFNIQHLDIYASSFFPYKSSLATIPLGIVKLVVNCQRELNYTNEQLSEALSDRMNRLSVPFNLFTVEECIRIFFFEREKNIDALTKTYAKTAKLFKERYPHIKTIKE